ncbi:MAG: SDR family NAD(P)-dependent oxidoreductase [Acidimicrobiia bacterium]|jgi:NAD(P)-dependent dehydrogenase (short-subunit alcohol dehydrogenase family)
MELAGRSAIVTGAAGGLGAATARHLASVGVPTVVFDMNAVGAQAVADEIGASAIAVGGSVLDEGAVASAIIAAQDLGVLSIVVNVAGGGIAGRTLGRDGTPHDLDAFRKVVELNLVGTFNVSRLTAAAMSANEPDESGERGVIVHTASIAAFDGQIGQVAYAAAKGGLVGLTLPMARDLAAVGIRVMTIAPGTMGTPIMMSVPEAMRDALVANVPFPKRLGTPEEFAMLVEHFARNGYLNGTTVRLDGAVRFPPK